MKGRAAVEIKQLSNRDTNLFTTDNDTKRKYRHAARLNTQSNRLTHLAYRAKTIASPLTDPRNLALLM